MIAVRDFWWPWLVGFAIGNAWAHREPIGEFLMQLIDYHRGDPRPRLRPARSHVRVLPGVPADGSPFDWEEDW